MSHNLHSINGKVQAAFNIKERGLPWHKLGTMVQGAMTWQEASKLAGLDWEVEKLQFNSHHNGQPIDAYGIYRTDTHQFFGTVGSKYTPIQNAEYFSVCDALLEEIGSAHYESAGILGDAGASIFMSAALPHTIRIDGTDDVQQFFLMAIGAHDGSGSARFIGTSVRPVCQNTINMALGDANKGQLTVRHTPSAQAKMAEVKRLVAGVKVTVDVLRDKFNKLAVRKVDRTINRKVMDALFGEDWKDSSRKLNQIEQIASLFDSNDGNAIPEIKGTGYNLLNAITEYVDHFKDGLRGDDIVLSRASSAMDGTGSAFKAKALDTILALTQDAPLRSQSVSVPVGKVDSILSKMSV